MNESDYISSPVILGHDAVYNQLKHDFVSGKLAQGWLLCGPKGIGKATLANSFARMVLAGDSSVELSSEHPVSRRMAVGSHTDFLLLEQEIDSKKGEPVREITIEQARSVAQFLSLTPGESQWRVVIIDNVDALNSNAANAILKILEEPPPQALLLLISHNPGRLLPTIRSRCRMVRMCPPDAAAFDRILHKRIPDIEPQLCRALAILSGGAPGIAIELQQQHALALYQQIIDLIATLPTLDTRKIYHFAEKYAGSNSHHNWQLLTRLLLVLFERASLFAVEAGTQTLSVEEGPALRQLAALHPPAVWAAKWQQCAEQFSLASALHLDYKQVIITFFHSIAQRDAFQLGNTA